MQRLLLGLDERTGQSGDTIVGPWAQWAARQWYSRPPTTAIVHLVTDDLTEADRQDLEDAVYQCPTRRLRP